MILNELLEGTLGLTMALKRAASKIGLRINVEKTKIMELLDGELYQDDLDSIAFEKAE